MSSTFSISIIGAGNLAWNLALALENRGHEVKEIYSRTLDKAQKLALTLKDATPGTSLDFSKSTSRIFILAVTDDAIESIASKIVLPEGVIVAHTSGTKSVDALAGINAERGVFYPLQTFTAGRKLTFEEIPVIIESPSIEAEKTLTEIAITITRHVYYLKSERRKKLHIAAVFASNFVNHMLAVAKDVLNKEQIDFSILNALVKETVEKAFENEPLKVQTGPAVRRDEKTLKEHLEYLNDKPEIAEMYKIISQSIIRNA